MAGRPFYIRLWAYMARFVFSRKPRVVLYVSTLKTIFDVNKGQQRKELSYGITRFIIRCSYRKN
jgi:hypothetical protein